MPPSPSKSPGSSPKASSPDKQGSFAPSAARRVSSGLVGFVPQSKKLTIAEEVGKKLQRMEGKPLKEYLDIARREFDLGVSLQVGALRDVFDKHLTVLDENVTSVEANLAKLLEWKQATCDARIKQALEERDTERGEKLSLAKWMVDFAPTVGDPTNGGKGKAATPIKTDEVDFAFVRFALNMAVACDLCPVQKQLDAGIPAFLSSMLKVPNDAVVGPASLALSHLSLHHETKAAIVQAGGLVNCVSIVNTCQHAPIVTQCCKTLASLALLPANKPLMASRGAIKALVDLVHSVAPDNYRVSDAALGAAFSALANCAQGNDANRDLIVGLDVVKAIEYVCENWADPYVLEGGASLIGNLAYNNVYASLSCLANHCDEALLTSMKKCGAITHPGVCRAAMDAFANLSNSESNQTHVGASGAIELAVEILSTATDVRLLRSSAICCASMAYGSFVNKTRMGDKGAVRALLEVALGRGKGGDAEEDQLDAKCAEACCFALASLMLNALNQQILKELEATDLFVQLVLETESMDVLAAGSMVLAALTPRPDEKKRLLCEGVLPMVEEAGGGEALMRCKQWVFGRKPAPDWLTDALAIFEITEEIALREQRTREEIAAKVVSDDLFLDNRLVSSGVAPNTFKAEFFQHLDLFEEHIAEIKPIVMDKSLVDLADKLF